MYRSSKTLIVCFWAIILIASVALVSYQLHLGQMIKAQMVSDQITMVETTEPVAAEIITSPPTQITFDSLGLGVPIIPAQIANGQWQISSTAANFLVSSAQPGENGNVVIYAHNFKHLFGQLSAVKVGDSISLQTEKNRHHTYVVTEKKVVNPDQLADVLPTDHEVLTLYTCIGAMDSQRLIIRALPQQVSLGQ